MRDGVLINRLRHEENLKATAEEAFSERGRLELEGEYVRAGLVGDQSPQ